MDITNKRIILLLLLLPLIFFIGLSAYSMLNDHTSPAENLASNQIVSSSLVPTPEKNGVLTATITGKYIFSDNSYSLDLRTQSINTSELSSVVLDDTKWVLQNDEMSLIISTYIDESPFSTNADIEVVSVSNPQLAKSLFRIPLQDNHYFYSDSYTQQECGEKHCLNGLISIANSEMIEILCESKKQEGLKLCDELVGNIEIINIY